MRQVQGECKVGSGASGRQTVSQSQHLPRCMANNYDFSEWSACKCKSRWPLVWFRRRATLTHILFSNAPPHTHSRTETDAETPSSWSARAKDQYLKSIYVWVCVCRCLWHTHGHKKSLFLYSVVNVPGTYTVDAVLWMKMPQIKCDKSCHQRVAKGKCVTSMNRIIRRKEPHWRRVSEWEVIKLYFLGFEAIEVCKIIFSFGECNWKCSARKKKKMLVRTGAETSTRLLCRIRGCHKRPMLNFLGRTRTAIPTRPMGQSWHACNIDNG